MSGSYLLRREDRAYVTTLWSYRQDVDGNTLGEGTSIYGLTTWDDKGEIVFEGDVDGVDLEKIERARMGLELFKTFDGYMTITLDVDQSGYQEFRIDTLEGKAEVRPGSPQPDDDNPSLYLGNGASVTGSNRSDSYVLTNTHTGKSVTIAKGEAQCAEQGLLVSPIDSNPASIDGRYVVLSGRMVVDMDSGDKTCIDDAGDPWLKSIDSSGVAYGHATQNTNDVMIAFDSTTGEITVERDAMVVPEYIGPDNLAVVPSKDTGMYGVYAPKND